MSAQSRHPVPTRERCIADLAAVLVGIQVRRWADLLDRGPEAVARDTWHPWMKMSEDELAAYYRGLLKGWGGPIPPGSA